jgi:hypothetical protein
MSWGAPASDERRPDAIEEEPRPVAHHAAGDLEVLPAEFGQSGEPLDVPMALPRIGPVMRALEVDADEILAPAHVDDRHQDAIVVEHWYLCLRSRKPVAYEQQPCQRLPRRFGTGVDVFERPAKLLEAANAGM